MVEIDKHSPLSPDEIEQAFHSDNVAEISETLVTLALYDADWKKVEAYCLAFLEHPDASVRSVAATCIGHLARIHKTLDLDLVLPALYRHQSDPGQWVAGNVDNALSSIERFMQAPVRRDPAIRGQTTEATHAEAIEDEDEDEDEPPLSPEEIEKAFRSGDSLTIERTLVAMAFRNPDWRTTQTCCLKYMEHPEASVRGVAIECISHLIYNQHNLDIDLVRPALLRHLNDPSKFVAEKAKNALTDVQNFVDR